MTWRPWLIMSLLLAVVVANSALMYFEEIAGPEEVAEMKDEVKDKLAALPFTAGTRRANFAAFGLTDKQVEAAAEQVKRIETRRDRMKELLSEHADVVGPALCAGIGTLPQRYGAVAFLVVESEGRREVLDYERVTYFELQSWFDPALAQDVYNDVELAETPRDNATAMGLAAILLHKEDEVIEGRSPWGKGLGQRWSYDRMLANHPDVNTKLIAYLSFMHVLTEWANAEDGICG